MSGMMLGGDEIRTAIAGGLLGIDPLAEGSLQPASYDFRVGHQAFVSSGDEIVDVANRGLVVDRPR
jgi:deoxycytidine triphosphate deaminase